jgi:hypothetical protein
VGLQASSFKLQVSSVMAEMRQEKEKRVTVVCVVFRLTLDEVGRDMCVTSCWALMKGRKYFQEKMSRRHLEYLLCFAA